MGFDKDKAEGYIHWMLDVLQGEYEIQVPVTCKRNTSRTYYHPGKHQLVFGLELVCDFADRGYQDYKSIEQYFPQIKGSKGLEAIHQVVLHEFSHVLQHARYGASSVRRRGRRRRSIHNRDFVDCFGELLHEFPFNPRSEVWVGLKQPEESPALVQQPMFA